MSVQLVILLLYVVMLLAGAWYSTKLQKKTTNRALGYLLAGRGFPAPICAVMICGLAVGGASTVGVAETAYTSGFSAGWYNAAWGLGGIVAGLFISGALRKMNVTTVPEMMGKMFDAKTRFVGVIAQLLVQMSITSLQYVAGGSILTVLLPNIFPTLTAGMLASAVVFLFITLVGGFWASGITNVVNVIMIYIGIIVTLVVAVTHYGGMASVLAALPPTVTAPTKGGWMDPITGIGIAAVCGYVAVMVTQACSIQAVAQISFAAKSAKTARRGIFWGGVMILPAGFLCAIFGIIARSQYPDIRAALALPTIVADLSPVLGGIFLAALWAADISTATALLMGSSTLMLQDVIKKIWKIDPKYDMVLSRLGVLGVAVVAFILSLTVVGILRTITTALAILCTFTIFIFGNIYFPKLVKKAAGFWMILTSLVLWVLWSYVPAFAPVKAAFLNQLIYMEYLVCGIEFILFAVFAKEPATRLVQDGTNDN